MGDKTINNSSGHGNQHRNWRVYQSKQKRENRVNINPKEPRIHKTTLLRTHQSQGQVTTPGWTQEQGPSGAIVDILSTEIKLQKKTRRNARMEKNKYRQKHLKYSTSPTKQQNHRFSEYPKNKQTKHKHKLQKQSENEFNRAEMSKHITKPCDIRNK